MPINNHHSSSNQFDVIISGAGVVGMVLGGLLAQHDLSVLLIEATANIQTESDDIDPRTLAITPASKQILHDIGVWQVLAQEDHRVGQFEQIHVWDEAGSGRIEFNANDSIEKALGYIIENSVLHKALHQVVSSKAALTLYQPATINSIELNDDQVAVALEDGRRLKSLLLVAADGQRSAVREQVGIAYTSESYDQTAIAGVIKTAQIHSQVARQRFLNNGILALLPLWDEHHCGFVWSTDQPQAQLLLSMSETEFCKEITLASEAVIGEVQQSLSRQGFPLSSAQAAQYCQHRLALVGDAAHSVHPLAGQGVNLGIMDAAVLAEEIIALHQQHRDYGQHIYLRRYERRRRDENIIMMNVFSGFKQLFESSQFPIPLLRNSGMSLLDKVIPLKRWIMNRAMGLSGDVPANIKTTFYL